MEIDTYLSPQSKVAKLLEAIDEAPTPSPSAGDGPRSSNVSPRPASSIFQEMSDSDEDVPVRPLGRTVRRMLDRTPTAGSPVDDLYTATPSKSSTRSVRSRRSIVARPVEGLFVSPSKSAASDDDLPDNPLDLPLDSDVGRSVHSTPPSPAQSDRSAHDVQLDLILSDATRPARKASKKALLEMERETQRLAREQALAHQMKVKKKFAKSDLFAKLGFRQETSSSPPPSPDEAGKPREPMSTPPSSPPTPWDAQKAKVDRGALSKMVPVRQSSLPADSPLKTVPGVRAVVQIEDDLDILPPMPSHLKIFDRARPAKRSTQSKAIFALKHLAHLQESTTVDPELVNAKLIAQAKAQARKAQQERLDELKAKGVVIMSAEEQEREAEQLENLLDKARREAEVIRKQEKAAAKRSKDELDEGAVIASDDEDEDADWDESASLVDDAEYSSSDEVQSTHAISDEFQPARARPDEVQPARASRRNRKAFIVVDDEDDTTQATAESVPQAVIDPDISQTAAGPDISHPAAGLGQAAIGPDLSLGADNAEDPFAAFGFDSAKPAFDFMSPTQAFKATMQTPSQFARTQHAETPFGMSPTLQRHQVESQSQLVPASQGAEKTQQLSLHWDTQMPETPLNPPSNLSETPGWEPSQDAGIPSPWTAARKGRLFVDTQDSHDTQSTVRVRISESPPQRRGRLTKGVRRVSVDALPVNAFSEMKKRRLDTLDVNQRAEAEREMRNMMDEQAEESEDEYAGLGGDDSNMIAPETAEDRAMIDESNIEIGEDEARKIAQFYAEKQRKAEEEATSKLFKDITTGALRRRQGVDWELDEDEDEIAARRRQMRQREEARKRKLLLQDENVKGLLEGKGNTKGREAFLLTIGDDDELDEPESPNKRPLEEPSEPPAKRRPISVLQIRQSLSFLLDEPEVELDDSDPEPADVSDELAQDSDGDDEPARDMAPPPLPTDRLPASQRRTPAVIDRLSLRRGSSSDSSGWSAWSTGSGTTKAPSLLRRATSNLSNVNDRGVSYGNDRGVSVGTGAAVGKKSSLAYQARAEERRVLLERSEKQRLDGRRKIAAMRRQHSLGNASLGGGQWE